MTPLSPPAAGRVRDELGAGGRAVPPEVALPGAGGGGHDAAARRGHGRADGPLRAALAGRAAGRVAAAAHLLDVLLVGLQYTARIIKGFTFHEI